MSEDILVERRDHVALVTINRPERLNAFDSAMVAKLTSTLEDLDRERLIRAIVLTGAGDKAFVAGGDVKEMRDLELRDASAFVYAGQEMTRRIELMGKPAIAAVNGVALGGGTELALACDIRIASTAATFGLPEVTLGLLPGWGGTQRAARVLGRARALEIVLTGRRFDAQEALRIGLVQQVCAPADLLNTAIELAETIARNSPVAVQQAKKAIQRGADAALEQGLAIEAEAWLHLIAHPDRREGISALLERRLPSWRD